MSTYRVQMDVSYEFLEVDFLFADDRLVAVLKELAVTVMTVVEGDGVTREELPHERCDTRRTASQKKVGVIGHEGPSIAGSLCLRKKHGQAGEEISAIFISAKDILALYSPDHNVVEKTCCIEAGLAGHYLNSGTQASRLSIE